MNVGQKEVPSPEKINAFGKIISTPGLMETLVNLSSEQLVILQEEIIPYILAGRES